MRSMVEHVADIVLDRCLNLGAQFNDADALIVARAALEATSTIIEERWGSLHPGVLAINAALEE